MQNENTSLVVSQNGKALTTSSKVAEIFGKRHDHVLRDIRNILEELKNIKDCPIFGEMFYLDKYNRQQFMYIMDKNALPLYCFGTYFKKLF